MSGPKHMQNLDFIQNPLKKAQGTIHVFDIYILKDEKGSVADF